MKRVMPRLTLGMLTGALLCSAAAAAEIYKWVTPDGVTHYSEIPPDAALSSLEIIEVEFTEPASPAASDYQSVLDVAKSLEASRLERQRLRLERRQRQTEQQPQAVTPDNDGAPTVWMYSLPYHRYPPYRRHPPSQRYPRPPGYSHFYGGPRTEQTPWPQRGPGPRLATPYDHPNSPGYRRP